MGLSKLYGQTITQENTCIGCCNKFTVSVIVNGQGSTSKLRRRYCSQKCAKQFRKANGSLSSIELECVICHKIFYLPQSLAHLAKTCSNECRIANMKNVVPHVLREIRLCKTCSCEFEELETKNTQYCSLACFYDSIKTSHSVKCLVCNESFQEKKSQTGKHKFCSRKCQMIAQSNGMIKIHMNGRCGRRVDLGNDCFRSSFEADYARVCNFFDIKYQFQPKTFEWKNGQCHYTPDFYHPDFDFYVELKSRPNSGDAYSVMMTKNLDAHDEIRSNYGIVIYTLYMNDFYQILRDSNVYWTLPNLEKRNYRATKCLILKD